MHRPLRAAQILCQAIALSLLAPLLAACAGSGNNPGTTSYYAAQFEGLKIRRIGNDQVGNREFQNRAIANALADLAARGVDRDRIENVTVSTSGGEGSSGFGGLSFNYSFDLWFNIKGCESSIVYRAGPTGRITTGYGGGECLQ